MTAYETQDQKWSAVVSRDRNAASAFVFSVTTTGIYCRPNCGARQPRKANVKFFINSEAATQAGYRACKRCKPEREYWDPVNDMIVKACSIIGLHASQGIKISLAEVASQCNVTKFYLHRTFKRVTGQTPRVFARTCCRAPSQDLNSCNELLEETHQATPTNWSSPFSQSFVVNDVNFHEDSLYGANVPQGTSLPPDEVSPDLPNTSAHTWAMAIPKYPATLSENNDAGFQYRTVSLEGSNEGTEQTTTDVSIQYTLKHTHIGIVLIAYRRGTICALKIGVSPLELVTDLREHFRPISAHEIDFTDEKIDTGIKNFTADILEALEQPSGKTIILPFSDDIMF